jgi:hypothetical protein
MKILLSGPIEGYLKAFFDHVEEQAPHWAICAGDFGIFPDPACMDKASRKHAGTDFSYMYVGADPRPINTPVLTIAGVHDDNRWLNQRKTANNTEILNNVHWLAQGYRTVIGWDVQLRVTGLGRAYSDATYGGHLGKRSHRHYTRHDVEKACSSGPTDLLVLYEHLDAEGLRNIIYATRPKLILNVEHPHRKHYTEIQGTRVVQLGRTHSTLVSWDGESFSFD